MGGQLIYLVGPSGSGKDSILRELSVQMPNQYRVMKRVVTRCHGLDVDDEELISESEFQRLESETAFALVWRANGLAYGIKKELDQHLHNGELVFVNGSREYWPQVIEKYPQAILVLVQTPNELLSQRLLARGRETVEEIELRLERNHLMAQELRHQVDSLGFDFWLIDNSGDLSDTVDSLRQKLLALGYV